MTQLWMKAIRESRVRLIMGAVMMGWICCVLVWVSTSMNEPPGASVLREAAAAGFNQARAHDFLWWRVFVSSAGFTWMMMGTFLAGAGMNTQTMYGTRQGVHPSMLFTLSLPVRRRDLVLTRSLIGALAAFVLAYVPAVVLAAVTPFTTKYPLHLGDAMVYSTFLAVGGMALYWLAVLLSAVLDEQYQLYTSWVCGALIIGLGMLTKLPLISQFVNFTSGAAWNLTHTISWGTVGTLLVISIALLVGTLRIAEQREY